MIIDASETKSKLCPQRQGLEYDRCAGAECMAWRWAPFKCDAAWTAAVIQAAQEIGDQSPNKVKAAKHVESNRAAYGLPEAPTHGWCGLGGRPE